MKRWISNQIAWHIVPAWKKARAFAARKKIRRTVRGRGNSVGLTYSSRRSSILVRGHGNVIRCGPEALFGAIDIRITGNNCLIEFGPRVHIDSLTIHAEGDNCRLSIGEGTYISQAQMILAEQRTAIRVGRACMFATSIEVRTGDAHGIFDRSSRVRLNFGADVRIGERVWIGTGVRILKGGEIADGSVVGAGSLVTKALVPAGSLFAGSPARLLREGIVWGWHLDRYPD